LWREDPRTRNWNDVDVWYWLHTYGDATAIVSRRESDGEFKSKGTYHIAEDSDVLVVQFDGREERYRLVTGGWIYVLPNEDATRRSATTQ
jgi:hypothetical protein